MFHLINTCSLGTNKDTLTRTITNSRTSFHITLEELCVASNIPYSYKHGDNKKPARFFEIMGHTGLVNRTLSQFLLFIFFCGQSCVLASRVEILPLTLPFAAVDFCYKSSFYKISSLIDKKAIKPVIST